MTKVIEALTTEGTGDTEGAESTAIAEDIRSILLLFFLCTLCSPWLLLSQERADFFA
jgi:hypothetical protein